MISRRPQQISPSRMGSLVRLIDSYRSGMIVVRGRSWTSDVIIFRDTVIDGCREGKGAACTSRILSIC